MSHDHDLELAGEKLSAIDRRATPATELARALYPTAGAMHQTYQQNAAPLQTALGLTQPQLHARQQEWTTTIDAVGLTPDDAAAVYAAAVASDVASASGIEPDAVQLQTWTTESRKALLATYGADYDAVLARVQKFARSHPTLATTLGKPGVGSRPDIVMRMAEHVMVTGYR